MIHQFLFQPGEWIGQGTFLFTGATEPVKFYTKWIVQKSEGGKIHCLQKVEISGEQDQMENYFVLSDIESSTFTIELTNDLIGVVQGKGIIDPKLIAWEFKGNLLLEGFEVFELQEDKSYRMHGEYCASSYFRNSIQCVIRKKD